MDNVVICETMTFSANSIIHFPDGTTQKIPTASLNEFLPPTCTLAGVNKVKFACDNKEYVCGLIDKLMLQEAMLYGVNKIEYEVIE